jgi:hypothetical protein
MVSVSDARVRRLLVCCISTPVAATDTQQGSVATGQSAGRVDGALT